VREEEEEEEGLFRANAVRRRKVYSKEEEEEESLFKADEVKEVLLRDIIQQISYRYSDDSSSLLRLQASASSSSHVTMALPARSWSALHFCRLSAAVT